MLAWSILERVLLLRQRLWSVQVDIALATAIASAATRLFELSAPWELVSAGRRIEVAPVLEGTLARTASRRTCRNGRLTCARVREAW